MRQARDRALCSHNSLHFLLSLFLFSSLSPHRLLLCFLLPFYTFPSPAVSLTMLHFS